uniref:Ubiquitin-like domain-containing protein n=1 Tax=Taenia asiatica TaxID=60517 RepID=A0A0R3W2R5_TAEAS
LEPDPSGVGSSCDQILSSSYASGVPAGAISATPLDATGDDEDDEGVTVVSLLSPHAPATSAAHVVTASAAPTEAISASPSSSSRGAFHPFRRLFHPRRRRAHSSGKKMRRKYGGRRSSHSALFSSPSAAPSSSTSVASRPFDLRMRLSTGDEYSLPVTSNQSVLEAKRCLATLIGWPPDRQRWYCGGVALRDALRIADCPPSIAPPLSFVVQVVVHSPLEPESTPMCPYTQLLDDDPHDISQGEIEVAQASLDAKLFQSLDSEVILSLKSEFGVPNVSADIFTVSKYFCGLPVPRDAEGTKDKSDLIGAIVLLKGGSSSTVPTYYYSVLSGRNTSVLPADYDVYASVFCAKKSIANLSNPKLSRFMTLLERFVSVPLSPADKIAFHAPSFCTARAAFGTGGDAMGHSLMRAFAVANQVATAYADPIAGPGGGNVRLFTAPNTVQSRLEALAIYTALLTTWAGNDETRFLNYLKESTFSCTCPRLLLVHSMAQRRRTALMATLRKEAASVHSALPSLPQAPTSAEATNLAHPNWPHQMLTLLSEALCNLSVPLPAVNRQTTPICDRQQSQKQQGCVPEALVQRLWKITSYVETVLRSSLAQQEYAKLSSYPFLRIVEQKLAEVSTKDDNSTPWLQIYVGQPDSISLLLHALNITVGSTDQQRTAGRLVVEVLRGKPTRLRFILDGVDIGEALKPLGLCHGRSPICTSASFLAFLRGPGFWGFLIPTTSNSSETAYSTLCASADFKTMV